MSYEAENAAEDWDLVVGAFGGMAGTGWIRTNCPFCPTKTGKEDHKQSIGLNTETGGYNCFKCGTSGQIPEHLRDEIPYMPAAQGVKIEKPPVALPDQFFPLYAGPHANADWLEPARLYVRSRGSSRPEGGLPDFVAEEAFLGAAVSGWLRDRIIVPILDYSHPEPWDMRTWKGWVSRDYSVWWAKQCGKDPPDVQRPYLYPKNMDREGLLYNEPALWVSSSDPVFVVEGTLDVLALWPDAVAVLGKPLESQISKLLAAQRPVVVALDGDAWEEGWMLALRLRFQGQRAGALRFAPKVDPDEVSRPLLDRAARVSLETFEAVRVGF